MPPLGAEIFNVRLPNLNLASIAACGVSMWSWEFVQITCQAAGIPRHMPSSPAAINGSRGAGARHVKTLIYAAACRRQPQQSISQTPVLQFRSQFPFVYSDCLLHCWKLWKRKLCILVANFRHSAQRMLGEDSIRGGPSSDHLLWMQISSFDCFCRLC